MGPDGPMDHVPTDDELTADARPDEAPPNEARPNEAPPNEAFSEPVPGEGDSMEGNTMDGPSSSVPSSRPSVQSDEVTSELEAVLPVTAPFIAIGEPAVFDDEDDEWLVKTVEQRRVRMRWPTAILLALLIAGGAFWGGAAAERSHGSGNAASGRGALASAFRSLFAGSRGAFGNPGAGGAAPLFGRGGSAAVGTVTEVKGSTLYITNASGALVKVTLTPSTKITKTSSITAQKLKQGDTVVVRGTSTKSGSMTASSVIDGAVGGSAGGVAGSGAGAGGSPTFGGFGG